LSDPFVQIGSINIGVVVFGFLHRGLGLSSLSQAGGEFKRRKWLQRAVGLTGRAKGVKVFSCYPFKKLMGDGAPDGRAEELQPAVQASAEGVLAEVVQSLGLTLDRVKAALPGLDPYVLAKALVYAKAFQVKGTSDYDPTVFQTFLDGVRDGVNVSRRTGDIYVWASRV
jgi:hypothetical protein